MDKFYDERTMTIFQSAQQFIHKNKKLSVSGKKAYRSFIRVLINLYKVRHRAGKLTLETVIDKMEKLTVIGDKKWLLEKIAALQNKN